MDDEPIYRFSIPLSGARVLLQRLGIMRDNGSRDQSAEKIDSGGIDPIGTKLPDHSPEVGDTGSPQGNNILGSL